MRLPDPAASRAVLIGTSSYQHLEQLPAVAANVRDLSEALGDALLWGLPQAHCTIVADPCDPSAMLDPVIREGSEATDTLIVYYAGHGLRDADSADLYLALTGTREHTGYTAVAYEYVRAAIRQSPARRRIVVLDCCFSGRAARTLVGDNALAAQAAVDGAYVLSASPRDRVALAPEGELHTAFTGELLQLLRLGLADGPELMNLDTIYRVLGERLRSKNRPQPQRSQENNVGRLPLVRNCARATSGQSPAGPVMNADVRAAMVSTGLNLARLLRAHGRHRDALPILRLSLQEQTPGDVTNTFAVQLELSDMLTDTGQLKEAVEVLERAFHQTQKAYGPEAVLVCRRLADLLQESGNHIQACEVLKHALWLAQKGAPPSVTPPPTS